MKYGIIISDESGVIESLRLLLRDFSVIKIVSSGDKDIPDLFQRPVDFVIIDSFLSGTDQLVVLNELLSFQNLLSVIALVPSIHSPLVSRLKQAGAYAVVEKPFDKRSILELIERSVERRQLLEEIEYLKDSKKNWAEVSSFESQSDTQILSREVLRCFSRAISQIRDHEKLIELSLETIAETFNAGKVILLFNNQGSGRYEPISFTGYQPEMAEMLVFDKSSELPSWLLKHRQILAVNKLSGSLKFKLHRQIGLLEADIVIGLFSQGNLIGILAIGKKILGNNYSEDELRLLSVMTDYMAIAIENATLYRDLTAQRSYNDRVLNNLKTGVITVNGQGEITTFNHAAGKIMEIKPDMVIGKSAEKLGSRFADLLRRTLAGEGEYHRLEVLCPVNNKPLGVGISVMLDNEGRTDGAVMVFTDLSKIKKLEEEKKEHERVKFWAVLAGRLAHEVKNPLVPIKTFAQLIPERYDDPDFRNDFCHVVNKEVDRLSGIIAKLARFAELPQPQKRLVDVNEILEEALDSLSSRLKAKNVEVTKHFSLKKKKISADGDLIREAFFNILDNAVAAVSDSGAITVYTSLKRDSEIEVLFKDNGSGMNEEELNDIFIPFAGSGMGGMGLGLPIAQQIIKDHQGLLEVESAPGKGTSVKVILPR